MEPIERTFGRCFYKEIILLDESSIRQQIRDALAIEKAVANFIEGSFSLWELMELIEPHEQDMDCYCEEVVNNLENSFFLYD